MVSTSINLKIALAEAKWGPVNLLRQTHFYSGVCGNTLFIVDTSRFDECNYILSSSGKISECIRRFSIHQRIYLCMENPAIWQPSREFLSQFGLILTPFADIYQKIASCSKVISSFPCVPWFYDINFSIKSGLQHVPLKSNSDLFSLENANYPIKKSWFLLF